MWTTTRVIKDWILSSYSCSISIYIYIIHIYKYNYIYIPLKKTGFRSYQILSFGTHFFFCFANVPDMSIAWTMVKMASAQVPRILSPSSLQLLRSVQKQTMYQLFLGKLQYFINLNSSAIWEWCPLLTMIPVRSQWGRYNLPIYIYVCVWLYPHSGQYYQWNGFFLINIIYTIYGLLSGHIMPDYLYHGYIWTIEW